MEKIKVGISVGDLNGIGMEVIIKTLINNRMMDLCTPIVFGGAKTTSFQRKILGIKDFSFNIIQNIFITRYYNPIIWSVPKNSCFVI